MAWKSYLLHECMKPFFLILGVFLISISPLFISVEGFVWPGLEQIGGILGQLTNPEALVYINPGSGEERSLFPIIFKAFASSLTVLGIALVVSFSLALLGTLLLWRAPKRLYQLCLSFTSILQSIPDIVFVVASQMFLVWLYVETGSTYIKIAGAGEEEAVLAPALILSILPTIYFFQSMLSLVEEEKEKPYYEMAVSKGLPKTFILLTHILRNILVRLSYQAKFLISIMVSNLLIVEYLFENFGMTSFLLTYSQPPVFFVTALLFFGPVYLFLKIVELALYFFTRQEVSL
ncbi:Binding-protein-dependent transport system inner membrane component [Salimicrobium salexigens]|uniref:Binding-protein-dependent transport system inner membrane component n=2 Tax=Salimicrobium salexigens TaxID=908941 RepID=A0ABY1KT10_9BACI|nr:Binding-protein-dependent transport system inner membrane component [Salimicrobium salexigens]